MTAAPAGASSRDRRLALVAVAVSVALHGLVMLAWQHRQAERPQPVQRVEIELRKPQPASLSPVPEFAREAEPPPRTESRPQGGRHRARR